MSLNGLRILELPDIQSSAVAIGVAWAAKLFADMGADVVRAESEHDLVRHRPHDLHRWLNTNKRSVLWDPEIRDAGRPGSEIGHGGHLTRLLPEVDLVLCGRESGDISELLAQRPGHAVVCRISPFGSAGPYAEYAAEELSLIHGSAWGFLSPSGATDAELPPIKSVGHHATINVATAAAAVSLAAVDRAAHTGLGEHIDFSMFAAAAKMTEFAPAVVSFVGGDVSRLAAKTVSPWGIFECSDGMVEIICPEQRQWESLVELMGRPEWALREDVATSDARRTNYAVVDEFLGGWMATQKVDDLAVRAQEARICITPVNTMEQLEANQHLAARGFFATSPDGIKQPGPPAKFDQPWWGLRTAAPELGSANGQGWFDAAAANAPETINRMSAPTTSARPLEGVTVCDFTWVWAGPFCTEYLAHLGAEVIKLEWPERSCMFRRMPFHPDGVTPGHDTSGGFQIYNADKQSIGVDLGHADALEVVRRMVAKADVVIDNFGVGTLDKLGFGIEWLRSINPDVIVASISGYGQTGPNASYMAYGPAGGSLAGLYAATGYAGGPPVETGVAIGDPGSGLGAAWSVVAALAARRRTGVAATIDIAMVEAVATTIGEPWMAYLAQGSNPERAGNHDAQWAPHSCYPADGEDRWVTIACTNDDQWYALGRLIGDDLDIDERFTTAADRKQNEAALDERIASWTSTQDRWETANMLQAVGVPAFPSLSPGDLWNGDPQLDAIGMLSRPDHPVTGARVVPGIPWTLTEGPNGLRRPAPCLGQHTDDVLIEQLGFTSSEVTALHDANAIFQGPG